MTTKAACKVTHELILSGMCPWCESVIIDGSFSQSLAHHPHTETSKSIIWNIPAFISAFANKSREYILSTLSDILLLDSRTTIFLPVLRLGINHLDSDILMMTVRILTQRGSHMSTHEAEQYEKILQDNPDDAVVRFLLLCYNSDPRALYMETSRLSRQRHILWMIERYPFVTTHFGHYARLDPSVDGEEAYQHAKTLWFKQIEKNENNTSFLDSIADFFAHHEPGLSETFYLKAKAVDSNNPKWSKKLAGLYVLQTCNTNDECEFKELAKKALAEYENAFDLETEQLERFWLLPDLAKQAFEAGELERAHNYATQLLQMVSLPNRFMQNEGDAIHNGHLVLGRLTLKMGDKEKAKWHLLEAGKSKGSPVLKSFGPNMKLAKELMDLGERDAVVQYLKLCSNFWQSACHQAEQWIYMIEHGDDPDFGPHL